MHPEELAASFDGVTQAEKDPHQTLLAATAEGIAGKGDRSRHHEAEVDPIGDGGEPIGFGQEHGREHLRDYETDNGACPNLRAQSKTHFFHSEITTPYSWKPK
jgi:hypothetical protein